MTTDVSENLIALAIGWAWQRVRLTFAFNPNLQIVSQSILDCSDAAGEVNSIFVIQR